MPATSSAWRCVIAFAAFFGFLSFLAGLIPIAAAAPVLVFVAVSLITNTAFAVKPAHMAAVAFAILPHISDFLMTKWGSLMNALRSAGVEGLPALGDARPDRRPAAGGRALRGPPRPVPRRHHHRPDLGRDRRRHHRRALPLRRRLCACGGGHVLRRHHPQPHAADAAVRRDHRRLSHHRRASCCSTRWSPRARTSTQRIIVPDEPDFIDTPQTARDAI